MRQIVGAAPNLASGWGFTHPGYGFGLTQQSSDDLQFILRFLKVMIWVWIATIILGVLPMIFFLAQLVAVLGTLSSRLGR